MVCISGGGTIRETAAPTRRTQAERSASTREALLDATVACLAELGYAATTTREVAARAGVSRGAQTHHFPAKADLVTAAVQHVFDRETRRFRDAFVALPPAARTVDRALGELWAVVSGPSYDAILEVTVAARTDPDLRVVIHGVSGVLEATVVGLLRELFPAMADESLARTVVDLGFTIVQGAAVARYAGYGDPERTVRLARMIAGLLRAEHADLAKGLLDALDP